jgi:hypothetical protein|tara:strand:+ start:259 stop:645 length:387 start_codon:yes stop_codon:yes gene_type:complete
MVIDSYMNPASHINYGFGGKLDESSFNVRDGLARVHNNFHPGHLVIPLLLLSSLMTINSSCYEVEPVEIPKRSAKELPGDSYGVVKTKKYSDMSQAERDKLVEILDPREFLRSSRELLESIDTTVDNQ